MLQSKKYILFHGIIPAMLLELNVDTGYSINPRSDKYYAKVIINNDDREER